MLFKSTARKITDNAEAVIEMCIRDRFQRADDTVETVENRIAVYNEQTKPLVDYYTEAGNIAVIDGALPLDTVFAQIAESIGE